MLSLVTGVAALLVSPPPVEFRQVTTTAPNMAIERSAVFPSSSMTVADL